MWKKPVAGQDIDTRIFDQEYMQNRVPVDRAWDTSKVPRCGTRRTAARRQEAVRVSSAGPGADWTVAGDNTIRKACVQKGV